MSSISWQALVDTADPNRNSAKDVAYRFSNKREFVRPEYCYSHWDDGWDHHFPWSFADDRFAYDD